MPPILQLMKRFVNTSDKLLSPVIGRRRRQLGVEANIPTTNISIEFLILGRRRRLVQTQCINGFSRLTAGIVDVVLHLNVMAGKSRCSYQNVPNDDVSEMSDVPLFVRVNRGVLDQQFLRSQAIGAAKLLPTV